MGGLNYFARMRSLGTVAHLGTAERENIDVRMTSCLVIALGNAEAFPKLWHTSGQGLSLLFLKPQTSLLKLMLAMLLWYVQTIAARHADFCFALAV